MANPDNKTGACPVCLAGSFDGKGLDYKELKLSPHIRPIRIYVPYVCSHCKFRGYEILYLVGNWPTVKWNFIEHVDEFGEHREPKEISLEHVISFPKLLRGLTEEDQELLMGKLHEYYIWEVFQMKKHAQVAKQPIIYMEGFVKSRSQYIANFWVNDLSILNANAVNWHGQNTSQWKYAGCILVENGRVSCRH